MPLEPRGSRFASPLRLSRVHWVRPELVAEVKFLSRTDDDLLRQVVYEGFREDKTLKDLSYQSVLNAGGFEVADAEFETEPG
jgi:ATP-dependent DNA ligase